MTIAWLALVGLGATSALALFVGAVRRWPLLGAVSVAGFVLIAWEIPNPPPLATVAGTSVYFLDLLSATFLMLGLSRFPALRRRVGAVAGVWLAIGFLLVVSLLRGAAENDFGTAVNEFRMFLYPYAALTWAMSLQWNATLTAALIRQFATALGWGLVLAAGYHLARYGIGNASDFVDAGTGIEQSSRPLVSGQSLMLLMCAMVCLWFWRSERRRALLVSALAFMCVVVLAQQRTVWGVALAATAVVFVISRARSKGTFLGFFVVAVWIVGIILTSGVAVDLLNKLADDASNSGTYDARMRSWTNLIRQSVDDGPATVAFGSPMGEGFGRFESLNRWVTFAPHNWYLTVYLRVGLVGLSLLLFFLIFVLLRAIRARDNLAVVAILMGTIVYGWSYSWPWYISIFTGWAFTAGATRHELVSAPTPNKTRTRSTRLETESPRSMREL